jgi:predicted enzyme related to lactoylglutathione lyase
MAKKNPLVHFEWRSRDAQRLKEFYGSIFSWKFEDPTPGYTMIETGSKSGVGIFHLPPDQPIPVGICPFVEVDDLTAYEEKARGAGGNVVMSNQPVPGMGTFSVFTDPDGNSIGLWQTESPKKVRKAAQKAKKAAKKEAKAAKKQAKAAKKEAKKTAKAAKPPKPPKAPKAPKPGKNKS